MKLLTISGQVLNEVLTEPEIINQIRRTKVRFIRVSEFNPIYANIN